MSNAANNSAARDQFDALYNAGLSGLPWWAAPEVAEATLGETWNVAEEGRLLNAHVDGAKERARAAVRAHIAGCGDIAPEDLDVRALIETAARKADLPAEAIVEIVAALAPAAIAEESDATVFRWAEMALEDFQRIPARNEPGDATDDTAEVISLAAHPRQVASERAGMALADLPAASSFEDFVSVLLSDVSGLSETHARAAGRSAVQRACEGHSIYQYNEDLGQTVDADATARARDRAAGMDVGAGPHPLEKPREPAPVIELLPRHNPVTGVLDLGQRLRTVDFDPSTTHAPPTWLVKGLVPKSGLGLLYGESGAGKTFLAAHLAQSVSWGLPFFGSRVKRGGVLYVAAEAGASVVTRLHAANDHMQGAVAAANLTRDEGQSALTAAPIRIVTESPNLSREGDVRPLVRTIEDAAVEFAALGSHLALVIIDTWHAALGGADDNASSDTGHALAPLRDAIDKLGVHVMIVAHPGKDLERGVRGSNSLPAAADVTIELRVPGFEGPRPKSSHAMRRATLVKNRDGDAGHSFAYRLPIVSIGVDEDGDPWTTCVVQPFDEPKVDDEGLSAIDREFMDAIVATITDAPGGRGKMTTARLRFNISRKAANSKANPDAIRKAWTRAIESAVKDARIELDDQGEFAWLPAPT